jgi:N-acetylneuraminic acid mutarotase
VRFVTGFVVTGLVCSAVWATEPAQRTLTFDQRVTAQTAIERVYYSHQLGATKPFEEAVPATVIRAKVRKYLDQSAALAVYWKTSVTDRMLQRELERMAVGTRMPERLQELFAALGYDSFLVSECLVRPALVDRLTSNFYAFDRVLHTGERAQAEELHRRLVAGELSASAEHPNRTVTERSVSETPESSVAVDTRSQTGTSSGNPGKQGLERPDPADVGRVSGIKETREAFAFDVVLSQTATSVRVANYVVNKTPWDSWWHNARLGVHGDSVQAVASGLEDLPALRARRSRAPSTTCADDHWDNGMLDDIVPDPRTQHVAVWTGTQMIIWGGNVQNLLMLQSGGRYDPATDTWTATSLIGAPIGRYGATAVWAGNRMVVWGGKAYRFALRGALNSGARYDPVSDTWTPTSGRGAPAPRYAHSAVSTGSRMLIWGGVVAIPSYPYYAATTTGGQYDLATDTWTPMSKIGAPAARTGESAVWTGSLMVIWGGSYAHSGARYDPVSDHWTPTSEIDVPRGRHGQSAVWTGSEMIVWGGSSVFLNDECDGGQNPLGGGICVRSVNTGGRYNPASDTWVATSNEGAPFGRERHVAIWTGSSMLIWGGADYWDGLTDTGGRYDPVTDSWSPTSQAGVPSVRQDATAVWTGSLMVIWGGYSRVDYSPYFLPENTGARYDPASDSWTPTDASLGQAGTKQKSVWTGNLMLIWGGDAPGGRYDPVNDTWTAISTIGALPRRAGHTAVWTGTQMIVWGGGYDLSDGGRYEPVSDAWSPTSATGAPSGRSGHTAVWTGSSMVIWGGLVPRLSYPYIEGTTTGGRYDPVTDQWTPTSETGAPSGREQHTAIWTGSTMVVWGGGVTDEYGDHLFSTGGRYDPATDTWVPTSTTDVPYPRSGHTAVWTGSLMIVWGGEGDCCGHGSGGRYDPVNDSWTPTSTTSAPSPRFAHSAVWTGTLMVVWGGFGGYGYIDDRGARYDPSVDGWSPMSTTLEAPLRGDHTAVWTGTEMIVCGGDYYGFAYGGGGRYYPGRVMDNDCDGDGITGYAGDCDDHNASIYPGAPQICDGINNDCNDPHWPGLFPDDEIDWDGDGFLSCGDDCDDHDSSVYPGAPQICDGVNDDCNDPTWPAVAPNETDADHDGAQVCYGDCNDSDRYIGPGFDEYCDGRDNDCNGIVDDGDFSFECTDRNSCTDDICGGLAGCLHPANHNSCDDLNTCTSNDVCGAGRCSGTPTTGASCTDNNDCTSDDRCDTLGRCAGSSPCDDGDQCTRDYADPTQDCACSNYPTYGLPCDDGNACTTKEYCSGFYPGYTCGFGQPVSCSDDNPCTDDTCIPPSGGCVHVPHDGGACSDGNPCTQSDICGGGVCAGSTPVDCAGPCPAGSTPTEGGCSVTYDIDGDMLDNLDDACDEEGLVRDNDCYLAYGFHWADAGLAIGPVLRVDVVFNPSLHCALGLSHVILNGTPIGEFLSSGTCSCEASDASVSVTAASVGSYSTSSVNHIYVDSGAGCEGISATEDLGGNFARVTVTYQRESGVCVSSVCDPTMGGCVYSPAVDCDDGNPCTDDSCDSALGCVHTNNIQPCDDGNACTSGDACAGGVCSAGTAAACAAPVFVQQPSLGTCATLWPPNHGYADFTVADTGAVASSQCGIASLRFASCSSSQPENGTRTADGNSMRDCVYEPGALHLRAERDGACSPVGRVYEMQMIAVDVCGNATTSNPFRISVWHDRAAAPSTGTIYQGNGGSGATRPGTNGTYGPACGAGSPACGESGQAHDSSDADPQMEIAQSAAISVNNLHLDKAPGGNIRLTWTEPPHQPTINVTRFHIYRLDPLTLFWTQIAEVTKQSTSWLDPVLNDAVGYAYKVTAVIK